MWQEAELVLRNYIPDEITLGMFFIRQVGEQQEIYTITKLIEITEDFVEKNGFPVRLFIETEIDDDVELSEELHLNSVFDSEKLDYYNKTSLKELNNILNQHDSLLEIMLDESCANYFRLPDNNFIIRYLTE